MVQATRRRVRRLPALGPRNGRERLPYPEKRVELCDEVDEYGGPRPLVTPSCGENDHAMRAEMHRLGTAILNAVGAQHVVISEGNDHTHTPVLGRGPESLRTSDHRNFYICDASVFVSPGGAQPSQMIMALATRLADYLDSNTHRKEAP